MFYLTQRIDEKQCLVGDILMVLSDFPGVPAGTKGVITSIYDEGVMVTWLDDDITVQKVREAIEENRVTAGHGFLSDGFSRDELHYLAFATNKHPKVDAAVSRI